MRETEETIETALFDVDGTLVASNDAHARAWFDALAEGGYDVAFERLRPLIGLGSDKLLPALELGLTSDAEPGASITSRRKAIFLERYVGGIAALPGARELVERVASRGVRCVVASSATPDELGRLLEIAGASDAFAHAMKPDDVEGSKPDPDIVVAALAWSGTPPERAVMIGDTRFDMEAAARAGVAAIGLRSGGSGDADLAAAAAIFDTPADLARALAATSLGAIVRGERTRA
jgi:HAD superfamily hydrolase (TIGR01509 family)